MSHITIIINREQPFSATTATSDSPSGVGHVSVSYTPEDSMTEDQVAQKLKKLYKQVKELGT